MVLLKNSGRTLPLDARRDRRSRCVGPLPDTLLHRLVRRHPAVQVTPLDGIKERLGAARR